MLAKIFDKTLKGNLYILYLVDMMVWAFIGFICGGGLFNL